MTRTLYKAHLSPPARAVHYTTQVLGLKLDAKVFSVIDGEHLKDPEFLALNPAHTVPTFVDEDGFVLYESRAIMRYLASKYDKTNKLYPTELKQRAVIDQILDYELGTLFRALLGYSVPFLFGKGVEDADKRQKLADCINHLSNILGDKNFFTGDNLTIVDISLAATLDIAEFLPGFEVTKTKPNLVKWLERVATKIPNYEAIHSPAKAIGQQLHEKNNK